MLSNYCSSTANKYDIKNDDVNKLVSKVANKSRYVPLYKIRQLYLSFGMKI